MSKRISVTLKDEEYAAVVKAVGTLIFDTGATVNVTDYIRQSIVSAACRDLKVNQISDLKTQEKD